jgi:hypothetical protein
MTCISGEAGYSSVDGFQHVIYQTIYKFFRFKVRAATKLFYMLGEGREEKKELSTNDNTQFNLILTRA